MSEWSLRDKVVLITGGAAGIGAATAAQLAQRGARCVLADVDAEGMARTAAALGGDTLTLELDVTDLGACERAVGEAVARHGGIDVVWANAGIATFGPLLRTDPGAWKRTIDVNLIGAFNTIRAALPPVIERRGYVAVTASLATFAHPPGFSAYSATKAGVEAMCDALRFEVKSLGVDVATIHPTWIATHMVTDADQEMSAWARLRSAMIPPFKKTYPVERAARDIARGFDARASRICSPQFVRVAHLMRSAMQTRALSWNLYAVAPDIDRIFAQEAERQGAEAASASEKVRPQVGGGVRAG